MSEAASVQQPDVPAQPPKAKKSAFSWLKKAWFDLIVLLGATICFTLFAQNTLHLNERSGMNGSIGIFSEGSALRKSNGILTFSPVKVGDPVFNMEVFFTGKDEKATIQLDNGLDILMDPMTLVLVKNPFKPKTSLREADHFLKLLRGGMKIRFRNKKKEEAQSLAQNNQHELPGMKSALPGSSPHPRIVPLAGSIHYLRTSGQFAEMRFGWPTKMKGTLVIRSETTGLARYFPLDDVTSAVIQVRPDEKYRWQIIDATKKTILGPQAVEIRILTDESARKLILGPREKNVEVHW
jgi:hypothetical protein